MASTEAFGEPQQWYNLAGAKRCRHLGHKWSYDLVAQRWVCIRYKCAAWYDPAAPDHVQWVAEEWYSDLPPHSHGEH